MPRGRFVVGQITLAKVPAEVFTKLVASLPAEAPRETPPDQALAEVNGKPGVTPVPAAQEPQPPAPSPAVDPWQQIKVGDIVLAEYSKEDGWWEARVTTIEGDLLRLSWCDGTGPWREVRSKVALSPRRA